MRSIELASGLMAVFVLAGPGAAQPPETRREPPPGLVQPAPIGVDDIVDWIMSFDKDKKGKVTKDDLPERMQFLIEKGDTNKDGALDKEEVKALATKLQQEGFGGGGGIRAGGFRASGVRTFGNRIFDGGQLARGPGADRLEGVVDDLKLSGAKKDLAKAAIKAHEENARKLMDQARADLLKKMKEILSAQEFEDFKAAMDRPRGEVFLSVAAPPGALRPGEFERRIEQLQKEVDELRRQQRH